MLSHEQNQNITWAIKEYRKPMPGTKLTRDQLFKLYLDYYEGRHKLTFATQKFIDTFGETFQAMAENLCPIVIDVVADLLQVKSHTSRNQSDADRIEAETQEINRRNRMDQQRGQNYRDAMLYGQNYVIVWPDPEDETWPVIHANEPGSIVVKYDKQKLGLIIQAAKYWIENDKCRLNLYFPDRTEKYVTVDNHAGLPNIAGAFMPFVEPDERWPLPNPYDRVPVFAYINNDGVGGSGRSELRDIIPPQDGLNKSLCDMLVAMEFEAFAQRWATGLEVEKDDDDKIIPPFKAGVDRIWGVLSKDTKFGEFTRADLKQFVDVQNSLRASIARVAGFPLHFFMIGQDTPPSGTSLIVASARLTSKVKDRQVSFGETDEDIMRFCLKIRGLQNVDVKQEWVDTSPQLDDTSIWEAANKQMAVTGRNQALRDQNFSDEQIARINRELWEQEIGDGAPNLTGDDASGVEVVDPATAAVNVLPVNDDGTIEAGVVTTQTLNGTQISSAVTVIEKFKSGEIFELAATELLVGVGMLRDKVAGILAEMKALVKIKPKTAEESTPAEPPVEPPVTPEVNNGDES